MGNEEEEGGLCRQRRPAEAGKAQSSSPSPEEGRRLVVAFAGIRDAGIRDTIINLIEMISRVYTDEK
jgi:hypothetical protein